MFAHIAPRWMDAGEDITLENAGADLTEQAVCAEGFLSNAELGGHKLHKQLLFGYMEGSQSKFLCRMAMIKLWWLSEQQVG